MPVADPPLRWPASSLMWALKVGYAEQLVTMKETCDRHSAKNTQPDAREAHVGFEGEGPACGEAHCPEAHDVEPHQRRLPAQTPTHQTASLRNTQHVMLSHNTEACLLRAFLHQSNFTLHHMVLDVNQSGKLAAQTPIHHRFDFAKHACRGCICFWS